MCEAATGPPRVRLDMTQFGKLILITGAALVVLGAVLWGLGRVMGSGWRGLPGDIFYQSERVTVFIPLVTCLLLSALLTLGIWLWQWMQR